VFQKDFVVKGLRPPKAALRALDNKIFLKLSLAVAIDGGKRRANCKWNLKSANYALESCLIKPDYRPAA
jgi:hypothetical protein